MRRRPQGSRRGPSPPPAGAAPRPERGRPWPCRRGRAAARGGSARSPLVLVLAVAAVVLVLLRGPRLLDRLRRGARRQPRGERVGRGRERLLPARRDTADRSDYVVTEPGRRVARFAGAWR